MLTRLQRWVAVWMPFLRKVTIARPMRLTTTPLESPDLYEGHDLRAEFDRLCQLQTFRGKFERRLPELKIRRSKRWQKARGYADADLWRVHVTICPGLPLVEVRMTLLHELTHLYVGCGWGHRTRFKRALARAAAEAWQIDVDAETVSDTPIECMEDQITYELWRTG